MTRPAAAVLAERAPLSRDQRRFRAAANGRLDFALPRGVWLDHRYSVVPGEIGRPRAARRLASGGAERWFYFTQVAARAVNPRARRRVTFMSGGTMSNIGRRRPR